MLLCCRKRSLDLLAVRNVELLNKQLFCGVLVLQICKDLGFSESGDDPFAAGEDSFDETLSETR